MPSLQISFFKTILFYQMKKYSLVLFVLAFGIVMNSCNDPSPIGAELLEEDQVDVFFTDTITLVASTVQEDSLLVFDPNPSVSYGNFIFGDYVDPLFGNTVASIYAQLVPSFDEPNFEAATLDSVILNLQYDTTATYGNIDDDPFGIGIYRITEMIDKESNYFSNQTFMVDDVMPLAEISNFTPMASFEDTIKGIIDYTFDSAGDTLNLPPTLRIPLPNSLGQEFINYDTSSFTSNSNFVEQFSGIFVKPLNTTPGLLSFDISSVSVSGLTVYYRQDTTKSQYNLDFSNRFVQMNNFKHDYSGAIVDDFFDNTTEGDSILFIQAMSGPNVKIELPYTEAFQDVVINKAELEFTVAELVEDQPAVYTPMETMIAADIGPDGEFVFVSDVLAGGSNFGGLLQDEVGDQGENIQQFRMNLSAHFQEVVEERRDNVIFLRAFPKQEQSSRVVIYGPGHSKYPMKLRITYTKLN